MGLGPSAPYHLTPSDQLSQVLEGACQLAKTPLEIHPRGSKIEAGGEYLCPSHYAIYSSLILTISQIVLSFVRKGSSMLRETQDLVRPTLSWGKAARGGQNMGFRSEPRSPAYPLAVVKWHVSVSLSKPWFPPL